AYRALPDAAREFLRQVPAAWEETRALSGEPGRSVVVARRGKDGWYVGGLNGQEAVEPARVDFSFLGAGGWSMTLIRDGAEERSFASETRKVAARDILEVPMRARGGFVMRITRD
ncbi:MAG TPA: glycoside hydrolase family 97 C-terminal domain-containing protein, partial [Vicinamibacteria bacterium]|nr:glycoside hydrolase family 97 C-terminal domain-containing protein [Vicinamibacteria bacterium]